MIICQILFNKVLDRLSSARPKSHGNYVESIALAAKIIEGELSSFDDLDNEDIPAFMLILLSDGKPSDVLPEHAYRRNGAIIYLSQQLKSKLTFFGMAIGASGSDFEQLRYLVDLAEAHGANGEFNHAGLSPASLSTTFSSMATSMTATRIGLLSTKDEKETKTEKKYTMRKKVSERNGATPMKLRRETNHVSRHLHDDKLDYPWRQVDFIHKKVSGFEMGVDPFGMGAERLAYTFYEVKRNRDGHFERVGKGMVAKESKYTGDRQESKELFHEDFCRVQQKAKELAKEFNRIVYKAPLLKPTEDEASRPPPIKFLNCSVYEYDNISGLTCGLLVENYLNGKFTKYNGNNGYVLKDGDNDGPVIDLEVGEVKLTDFVQAFSHWVYVKSDHNMMCCDLQGILDLEGRRPVFRLTDPVICSNGKRNRDRYGKTDIGAKGFRMFFGSHECNGVCKALNLPGKRSRRCLRSTN